MFSDLKKHVLIQHDLTIRPELMIFDIRIYIRFDTVGQQYCKSFVLRQQIRCALSEQFDSMWVVLYVVRLYVGRALLLSHVKAEMEVDFQIKDSNSE